MEVVELSECWIAIALPGEIVLQKLTALHLQTVAEHGSYSATNQPSEEKRGRNIGRYRPHGLSLRDRRKGGSRAQKSSLAIE